MDKNIWGCIHILNIIAVTIVIMYMIFGFMILKIEENISYYVIGYPENNLLYIINYIKIQLKTKDINVNFKLIH